MLHIQIQCSLEAFINQHNLKLDKAFESKLEKIGDSSFPLRLHCIFHQRVAARFQNNRPLIYL